MDISYVKHPEYRKKRGIISHWRIDHFIYQFETKELAEYFIQTFRDEGKEDLLKKGSFNGLVRLASISIDMKDGSDYHKPPLIDGRFDLDFCMATIMVGEIVSNKFEADQAAHETIKKIESSP